MDTRQEQLERLCAAWDEAGLPADVIAPTKAAIARHNDVVRDALAIRDDETAVLGRIVDRIASGDITLREGIEEHLVASAPYGAV